jgi:hypothetical protein
MATMRLISMLARWTATVAIFCTSVRCGEPAANPPKSPPVPPPAPPPVEQKLTVYDLRRTDQPLGEVRVGRLRFSFADLFVLNEAQRTAMLSMQDKYQEDVAKEVEKAIARIKALRAEYEKKLAELLPAPEARAVTAMWAISEEYDEARKKLDAERRKTIASLAEMDAERRKKTLDELREKSSKLDEEMAEKLKEAMTEEQRERFKPMFEKKPPERGASPAPKFSSRTARDGGGKSSTQPEERRTAPKPGEQPQAAQPGAAGGTPGAAEDAIAPEDKGLKRGRTPKPGADETKGN